MKETEIYLIRHGKIDNPNDVVYGRMPNFPLSEEGKRQVFRLAKSLKSKGVRFEIIYCSPLEIALQTATILKDELGVDKIEIKEELNDVDSRGLEGKPLDVLREANFDYAKLSQNGFVIESPKSVLERINALLDKVKRNDKGSCVAFVTHGDPSRILLWSLQNPHTSIPERLRDATYLAPGKAVVLNFGSDGQFLDLESS